MESICQGADQNGRCFFCARSDPGIFVPFFMGFRGGAVWQGTELRESLSRLAAIPRSCKPP